MKKYTPVNVLTEPDEFGNETPTDILWANNRRYHIQRIIQVCQPEDKVIRYTVLIADAQRQLFYNGTEWRIYTPIN